MNTNLKPSETETALASSWIRIPVVELLHVANVRGAVERQQSCYSFALSNGSLEQHKSTWKRDRLWIIATPHHNIASQRYFVFLVISASIYL